MRFISCLFLLLCLVTLPLVSAPPDDKTFRSDLSLDVPPISKDTSVNYDFDIVYVRAPRREADGRSRWAEVGDPRTMEPGSDLVLLHPDGKEEVLVPVEGNEAVTDPQVSFDARWVYFAKFHDVKQHKGSDIY